MPRESLLISKRLIKEAHRAELEATVERESQLFVERLQTPEAKAALRALLRTDRSALEGSDQLVDDQTNPGRVAQILVGDHPHLVRRAAFT